ncbi:type IV pilus modification protein PilV [Sedimenticola hydrogenitrophicus]|uniref:type IV pilus modification protein PilV n=1 Tax=Sedimenticola hydrogenitrophicus TaxID=2967975 RepID=UPI0021A8C1AC|nr:type IV pilus modification protein PilV [Sedimenticola hydrogenitrophicus]
MFAPDPVTERSSSLGRNKRRQCGFSMIEVLISIVVLAIGLLGIAGLQLSSLKGTDSANYRSTATMLSYDIVDKMHANRALALAGSYSIAMAAGLPASPTTIQDVDIANWLTALDTYLPSGDGSITIANGVVTVTVQWDDSRGEGSTTESFQLSTAL